MTPILAMSFKQWCKAQVFFSPAETRHPPDIRPDNQAFFDIQYPEGYRIWLAGYLAGYA
jgi:hypothetical protein